MFQTIKYKFGFIHLSYPDNKTEIVRVQVDPYAYSMEVKSIHSAKIIITKHEQKIKIPVKETCRVKWFNDAKGYGYLRIDGHEFDIFVHYSAILNDGFKTLTEGSLVTCELELINGTKDYQAFNVMEIRENK